MIVRCVTAGTNPQGEPDFHFCKVECDDEQYSEGEHYFAAREQAERGQSEKRLFHCVYLLS